MKTNGLAFIKRLLAEFLCNYREMTADAESCCDRRKSMKIYYFPGGSLNAIVAGREAGFPSGGVPGETGD